MVLSFIIALIKPVIAGIHFSGGGSEVLLNEALAMCLVCILLAILVWRAPGLAADTLAASPSLSAAHVAQHVTGALTTGAAAFSGGAAAATKVLRTTLTGASKAKASEGASSGIRSPGTAAFGVPLPAASNALGLEVSAAKSPGPGRPAPASSGKPDEQR